MADELAQLKGASEIFQGKPLAQAHARYRSVKSESDSFKVTQMTSIPDASFQKRRLTHEYLNLSRSAVNTIGFIL